MSGRKLFNKPAGIVMLVLAILILSLLITISNQKQNQTQLPAYQATESTESTTATATFEEELTDYKSEALPYSMKVPAAWQYVLQDNCPAYVNEADGTTVKFIEMQYNPSINTVTKDSLQSDLSGAAGTLVDFAKLTSTSYISLYEISGIYYLEYTVWDHSNIIRVVFMYQGEHGAYYTEFAKYLLDTFYWEWADPIPAGYYIYYSNFGNFEFGVPESWEAYIDNGSFIAISPSQSQMLCTVTENDDPIQNIDAAQFANLFIPNVSEYNVVTFQNTGAVIVAEYSFISNGVECRFIGNVLSNNGYIYQFALLCSIDAYSVDGESYIQSLNLFHVF